jgi:hypothetical protein
MVLDACEPASARLLPGDPTQARAGNTGPVTMLPAFQVAVKHFPMEICALDGGAFVLPAASAAVQLGR